MQTHFAGHPLGQSILGTAESITDLQCEQMREYHLEQYKAGNLVLALTGNTDWDLVMEYANKYCQDWSSGSSDRSTTEATPGGGVSIITKESSLQQHVMQMTPAPTARDEMRFAAELLAVIVGDDSGSRLYWDLVDTGHAEAAELGYNEYDGSGTYLTYLSGDPGSTDKNLGRIQAIYNDINSNGVSELELEQAKNKVASRVVLRSERPMGRLSSLGGNWVYRNEYRSVEDDLNTLRSMRTDDIAQLLEVYPLSETTTVAVGPLETLSIAN
jgi:predicted Zn-dependent peptidase